MARYRKNSGDWMRGKKRPPFSDEWRRRIGDASRGRKMSDETKKRMSESHKGLNTWMTGRKLPEETRKKMGRSRSGEKHHMWKGGKSVEYRRKLIISTMPDKCEVCAIPSSEFKKGLCYDHDHQTGKFRGWLCSRCNVALGMTRDRIDVLEKLILYLKKNG